MSKIRNLNDFLALLKGVKPTHDGQYLALCPGHHDTKPSLSVKQADGKLLLKCFAGCETAAILKLLGLDTKDLFLSGHKPKAAHKVIEAVYHYDGFEVVRTKPKGFYQRRPDGKGGFINNLKGITLSLYHQNELTQAIATSKPIFIAEGEKDVDNLRKAGFAATCNPMGAGKWREPYSEALRGADLIIIPDNDGPGRDHASQVARSCYSKAARIRMLELPGDTKDVSDWLAVGHTAGELTQLASQCPAYEPPPETVESATKRTILEDAVLALASVCDGAIEKDGQGFNKLDADLFHSLAESIGQGEPIAGELRPRVKRRIVKYVNQLTKLGININDMLLAEEHGEQNDGQGNEVKEALIPRLAEAILQDNHFAQDQGGKLYRYHEGVYGSRGAAFVRIQVKTLLDSWGEISRWSSHLAEEVVEFIRVDSPILWERPPLDTMNVLNGLLNVNTLELTPHSPDFLNCIQIPVAYDPTATCPAWDKFISEVFSEDALSLGYEIPAYLMTPDTSIQKASIILMGEGGNGKSTYLEAVRAFLGRGNTASLSLQKLESDRFAVARLVGKLANICPDLPSEHLAGTSMFKTITGGDTVTAEHKFRDSFDFAPYARLVFSANHPPQSSDSSQAFFDRWLVAPFTIRFRGEKTEIPRAVLDAQLACPRELSGVLNKALIALNQIHAHFGFTESKSMKAAWDEFRATTDPLAVWLSEATIESPDAIVAKKDLIIAYNREAEHKGQPRMTATGFGLALRRLRTNLQDAQRTVADKVTWVWLGIGLKSKESTNGDDGPHGSRSSRGSFNLNRAGDKKSSDKNREISNRPVKQDKGNRVNSVDSPNPVDNSVVGNGETSPATSVNAPDYPAQPCHNCGGSDYWLTNWNKWLCSRCHPKPEGANG